jgi:general secretion pathway protein E/type IV pilus assembly protein PilB
LLATGILSEDQLNIALREQTGSTQPLGRLLVGLGFLTETTLCDMLGRTLGVTTVDLSRAMIDPAAIQRVPRELAHRHRLIPLSYDAGHGHLVVAAANPRDLVAIDQLRALQPDGLNIDIRLAGDVDIAWAIDRHYGHELSIDGILQEIETGQVNPGSNLPGTTNDYSQPMIRLVDTLLTDAVKRGASDIHFEPEAGFLRIRYRIDGQLQQIRALHKSCWPAMAVRIKIICGMNIVETRAPQDGRLTLDINGHCVDFRASAQPTLHGENIVLRILDRQKGVLALEALGLDAARNDLLKEMVARPEGILLVTGPTGSGKTTTLYALIDHLDDESINIMTLEDPVEYPLPRVRQTSVTENLKLDFANGIRSLMRQDPDVILVGEIRDTETATMAFRAAMTGHRVLSTLHSNSAVAAVPRLLDIGIPADILASNVVGILAQRLVRRLCPLCREFRPALPHELWLLGELVGSADLPQPVGCPACAQQGYRGRLAIMEILRIDADIEELIERRASRREFLAALRSKGFRSLAEEGLAKVREGSTSLAELARHVDLRTLHE